MSYNVNFRPESFGVWQAIREADPDLLLIQDGGRTENLPQWFAKGWYVAGSAGCLILSRLPLKNVRERAMSDVPSWWGTYVRCQIDFDGQPVTLYSVHLDTPRKALNEIRAGGGVGALEANAARRLYHAAEIAAELRREQGPILVAGDLNASTQSLTCQVFRNLGLRDAFEEAGRGYGYTFGHTLFFDQSYIRIDHILTSQELAAQAAWTGEHRGSDHRPVIADFELSR
ncbi:MAG TPA: endonuclease/exonuclease/phosphatase family protein [Armatimonadota bacterium]|nr:endonuclease/exonuclease/phosphatase family protein [Armatimonadota bacterium]